MLSELDVNVPIGTIYFRGMARQLRLVPVNDIVATWLPERPGTDAQEQEVSDMARTLLDFPCLEHAA